MIQLRQAETPVSQRARDANCGRTKRGAVFVDELTMDNTEALESKVDDLRQQIIDLKLMLEKRIDQ